MRVDGGRGGDEGVVGVVGRGCGLMRRRREGVDETVAVVLRVAGEGEADITMWGRKEGRLTEALVDIIRIDVTECGAGIVAVAQAEAKDGKAVKRKARGKD